MKLYTFYTSSHRVLKDEWFLPGLQDAYTLKIIECNQDCPTGEFRSQGWSATMLRKCDLILEAIEENQGEIFIYSDTDVQFFRPTESAILKLMWGKDIIFQRDTPNGKLCCGFLACRANQKTFKLWQDAKQIVSKQSDQDKGDQEIINSLLLNNKISGLTQRIGARLVRIFKKKDPWLAHRLFPPQNKYGIKWGYLPVEFFGAGTLTGRQWEPGMYLEIPRNIILHHANWTVGLENKIAQLKFVRDVVESRTL